MLHPAEVAPYDVHRIDRATYHRLAELGVYDGQKVQLIDGLVITRKGMSSPHAFAVGKLTRFLSLQLGESRIVRVGLPIALSHNSEPEPDLAVVAEENTLPGNDHPSTAQLVIEVADSSRRFDLGLKAQLYAAARLPEYWVVDLQHECVVVHREPKKGRYLKVTKVRKGKTVVSTQKPTVAVPVSALFG